MLPAGPRDLCLDFCLGAEVIAEHISRLGNMLIALIPPARQVGLQQARQASVPLEQHAARALQPELYTTSLRLLLDLHEMCSVVESLS